jgi:protein PhnA
MSDIPNCEKCGSEFGYNDGNIYICPDCGHEWSKDVIADVEKVVKDANGNILKDGDNVSIIKDLKVKGSPVSIKVGVKVKNIRLVEEVNGHDIEAKVPGFGSMMLKSSIVKKST